MPYADTSDELYSRPKTIARLASALTSVRNEYLGVVHKLEFTQFDLLVAEDRLSRAVSLLRWMGATEEQIEQAMNP